MRRAKVVGKVVRAREVDRPRVQNTTSERIWYSPVVRAGRSARAAPASRTVGVAERPSAAPTGGDRRRGDLVTRGEAVGFDRRNLRASVAIRARDARRRAPPGSREGLAAQREPQRNVAHRPGRRGENRGCRRVHPRSRRDVEPSRWGFDTGPTKNQKKKKKTTGERANSRRSAAGLARESNGRVVHGHEARRGSMAPARTSTTSRRRVLHRVVDFFFSGAEQLPQPPPSPRTGCRRPHVGGRAATSSALNDAAANASSQAADVGCRRSGR